MKPQGPVVDWMREALANIWAALQALVHALASVGERIVERVDRLETKAIWAVVIIGAFMLLAGWIARGRK